MFLKIVEAMDVLITLVPREFVVTLPNVIVILLIYVPKLNVTEMHVLPTPSRVPHLMLVTLPIAFLVLVNVLTTM
jgi:hypothetical protein